MLAPASSRGQPVLGRTRGAVPGSNRRDPAGTPIPIEGRFRDAAVFELRHARGTYVEHGSCIVPGELDRIPAGDGPYAFFIYAEWAGASAGVAFRTRVEGGSVVTAPPEATRSGIDATLFGLVICDG